MSATPLKIIFAGTPHFSATALEALLAQRFDVVAVLTQPDRPAGRGMRLTPSPVKQLALAHGLPVLQPATLKSAESQQTLADYAADVMVVAAYGLILPPAVLQLPRHGCLNIHASLLPRWRGAAPIQRAILAGDEESGITIMQMDAGLDTGAMLLKKSCPITAHDTAQTLHDKLAQLGAIAIVEALHLLQQGVLAGVAQDDAQACYATKLSKAEAYLDWTQSAAHLARAVRAYNPFPIAHTAFNPDCPLEAFPIVGASLLAKNFASKLAPTVGSRPNGLSFNTTPIKIWQASIADGLKGKPGTVLAIEKSGIIVACGQDALCLEVLQRANGKMLSAAQFVQGFAVHPGDCFALPA